MPTNAELETIVAGLAARVDTAEKAREEMAGELAKLTTDGKQDERIAALETRLETLEKRAEGHAEIINGHTDSIAKIEADLAMLSDKAAETAPGLSDTETRLVRHVMAKFHGNELQNISESDTDEPIA